MTVAPPAVVPRTKRVLKKTVKAAAAVKAKRVKKVKPIVVPLELEQPVPLELVEERLGDEQADKKTTSKRARVSFAFVQQLPAAVPSGSYGLFMDGAAAIS
jgi:hypothetical protein